MMVTVSGASSTHTGSSPSAPLPTKIAAFQKACAPSPAAALARGARADR